MRGLVLVLILIAGWSDAARAAGDAHVSCVQAQLEVLGLDPGPVDGLNGPRTRSALAAFVNDSAEEAQAAYARLPGFSRRASVGWCREIGRFNPVARAFMPSVRAPERFVSESVSAPMDWHLGIAQREAEQFLREEYGVSLASQITLVAAVTAEEFRAQMRKTHEGRTVQAQALRRSAERSCGGPGGLGGSMYRDAMTMCGSVLAMETPEDVAAMRPWVSAVMVHEYVHNMQRELAYDKVPRWVRQGQKVRRRLGPAWMVEGTAEYIETQFVFRHRPEMAPTLHRLRLRALAAEKSLRTVRIEAEVYTREAYAVSRYAAELLAARFGDQSLIDFWVAVGETDNWFTAFKDTFGMSVQDFEALYPTLMKDTYAGHEFASDKDLNRDGLVAGRSDLPPHVDAQIVSDMGQMP